MQDFQQFQLKLLAAVNGPLLHTCRAAAPSESTHLDVCSSVTCMSSCGV